MTIRDGKSGLKLQGMARLRFDRFDLVVILMGVQGGGSCWVLANRNPLLSFVESFATSRAVQPHAVPVGGQRGLARIHDIDRKVRTTRDH